MAYIAQFLSEGLCVFSAGRKSRAGGEDLLQSAVDLFDQRHLAWKRHDLPHLGAAARFVYLSGSFVEKRSVILTFLLVTIAWVFFAAASVKDALHTLASFIRVPGELMQLVAQMKGGGGDSWERLATAWNRLVFRRRMSSFYSRWSFCFFSAGSVFLQKTIPAFHGSGDRSLY